ncbi:MAG TPA: recombinase family protein [Thermoanaerobaculia bacterium]|nr:recombinase family protein [Thermoanaerobaculia bacterium]
MAVAYLRRSPLDVETLAELAAAFEAELRSDLAGSPLELILEEGGPSGLLPGAREILARLRSGQLEGPLYVHRFRDLFRSPRHALGLLDRLTRAGVFVVVRDVGLDSRRPGWELATRLLSALVERRSEVWDWAHRGRPERVMVRRRVVVDPVELARLWEQPCRGRMLSVRGIARELKRRKAPASASTVARRLAHLRSAGRLDDAARQRHLEELGPPLAGRARRGPEPSREEVSILWHKGLSEAAICRALTPSQGPAPSLRTIRQALAALREEGGLFERVRQAAIEGADGRP